VTVRYLLSICDPEKESPLWDAIAKEDEEAERRSVGQKNMSRGKG